jgi:hypothetical protein
MSLVLLSQSEFIGRFDLPVLAQDLSKQLRRSDPPCTLSHDAGPSAFSLPPMICFLMESLDSVKILINLGHKSSNQHLSLTSMTAVLHSRSESAWRFALAALASHLSAHSRQSEPPCTLSLSSGQSAVLLPPIE